MSYAGPDPGNVEFCPICGLELWPFPVGDHAACEQEIERQMADAFMSDDDGKDLPFDLD